MAREVKYVFRLGALLKFLKENKPMGVDKDYITEDGKAFLHGVEVAAGYSKMRLMWEDEYQRKMDMVDTLKEENKQLKENRVDPAIEEENKMLKRELDKYKAQLQIMREDIKRKKKKRWFE